MKTPLEVTNEYIVRKGVASRPNKAERAAWELSDFQKMYKLKLSAKRIHAVHFKIDPEKQLFAEVNVPFNSRAKSFVEESGGNALQ